MSIDEAIAHARQKSEDKINYSIIEREEYGQLAEWLEELKDLREMKETIECNAEVLERQGYNKAIDDFVKEMKKYMETTEQANYIDEINNGNDNYSAMTIYDYVDELAEHLKESD